MKLAEDFRTSYVLTASRIFGMSLRHQQVSSGLAYQSNIRLNEGYRGNMSHSLSTMSRPFGLQHSTLNYGLLADNNSRVNGELVQTNYGSNLEQSFAPSTSKLFETRLKHQQFSSWLSHGDGRFNQDVKGVNPNFSLKARLAGSHNTGSSVENHVQPYHNFFTKEKSSGEQFNISSVHKTIGSTIRNPLSAGLKVRENIRLNEEESYNLGFRRSYLSNTIRGRSSILPSRLLSHQNTERYNKNLSNINGFHNITHTSRRGFDTMSEFRLPVDTRLDIHSVAGSVVNDAAIKAQFENLLENLHHSILNTVPNLPVESIGVEFDKAKKALDRINGFTQEIRDSDLGLGTSYFNGTTDTFNKPLKSCADIFQEFYSSNKKSKNEKTLQHQKNKSDFSKVECSKNFSSSEDEREDSHLFKKPKPFKKTRIKTPQVNKSLTSRLKKKVVSLKQWYPIAVGSDLSLCGVNEEGVAVKTEAIKKRINGRKIELVNGLVCSLIGSPSNSIVLPEKLAKSIKNGLAARWRVLQSELSSCQTAGDNCKKRKSKSPQKKSNLLELSSAERAKVQRKKTEKERSRKGDENKIVSPLKPQKKNTSTEKVVKDFEPVRKAHKQTFSPLKKGNRRKISTPKSVTKSPKIVDLNGKMTHQTRSGRVVKPVMKFSGSGINRSNNLSISGQPKRNYDVSGMSNKMLSTVLNETPVKKLKRDEKFKVESPETSGAPIFRETTNESFSKTTKIVSTPFKKQGKRASPRKKRNNSAEIIAGDPEEKTSAHSFTKKSTIQSRQTKRKRELIDAGCTKNKRSKSEKKLSEVESTVEDDYPMVNIKKQNKSEFTKKTLCHSKTMQQKRNKKKSNSKKILERETSQELKEITRTNDFELELDDIDIPEVGNMRMKPQLSRSQLRIVSSETPPLKYFNTNLKLLRSSTPIRSPDWCMSQRTESEVKQFQKRRAEAHKKIIRAEDEKTTRTEKVKVFARKDLKNVLDWVAEKNVRSPQWSSKVLQYVIRSRKQIEEDEEEDSADVENDFL